ncbi:MAG: hypothetical protein R8G33_08760 [Gammaproteobacteria bacterium]|nr:hypothetical protein [Gammaproteobacteria bacterium]
MMKKIAQVISIIIFLSLCNVVKAVGVAAGTSVSNTATVSFNIGGTPGTAFDTDVFQVQELINVGITWQDAANIIVAPGSTQQVLTFLLTNTGNGIESFSLLIDNAAVTTDDFNPVNGNIHIDGNANGIFDGAPTDPVYVSGLNDPLLDANGIDSQVIFLVSDIPVTTSVGETGISQLTANSLTVSAAGAVSGTILNGLGDGGIDAVVGVSQADDIETGTYQVDTTPIDVSILKTAQVVSDGSGCSVAPCSPIPGATIRYSLQVIISGVGTVNNLVITDPIPINTTYTTESINLNAISLTDSGVDADAGNFSANTVTVNLGDISSAVTHLITFDVTIN